MTPGSPTERPPYGAALLVFVAVCAGYVLTLAPTVTFWDAGEFIAAARILGIPHPPGTPLYTMLAHVWGLLVPFGEYAWRLNLMSACFSAAGAACWFLFAHEALGVWVRDLAPGQARLLRLGGAAAAAIVAAFSFTQWQNSNETEVYAVAGFSVAAIAWLAMRWRAQRATPRAGRHLLLAVYLGGLSMGNHLLALLAGPALVAFLAAELLRHPSADPATARREWGELAVVAGIWALLIGLGLGNTGLVLLGTACFVGAAAYAVPGGAGRFALLTALLAAVGVTTYLFLYIRAGQGPIINEADPSTFDRLLAVIRREQYGVRTPLDDPTELHGPNNPGRSVTLIGLQLLNYLQYFDWQWARVLPGGGEGAGGIPLRPLVTLWFVLLGWRGALLHRRVDPAGWWLVLTLFLVTGLGLVAYMNFKPGFTLGYDRYPDPEDHEVRERDYFFIVSFVTWGFWAGLGLAALARQAMARAGRTVAAAAVLLIALAPVLLNAREASRRHTPAATLARDFAYNLLNSVPPYGVVFTYGDNDTFPLWWAQEVEGIRRDVTVVCLALADTPWYMRQLRDLPVRPFDAAGAPGFWRDSAGPVPSGPLHTMTDAEIDVAVGQALPDAVRLRFGDHEVTLPRGTVLYGRDFASIRILQQNFGRRPMAWGLAATENVYGLDHLLVQQALVLRVLEQPPDTSSARFDPQGALGSPLDLVTTDSLLFGVYRYGALLARGNAIALEPTSRSMAATLGVPFTQMAFVAERRNDLQATVRYLEPAARLSANPALAEALEAARAALPSNRP